MREISARIDGKPSNEQSLRANKSQQKIIVNPTQLQRVFMSADDIPRRAAHTSRDSKSISTYILDEKIALALSVKAEEFVEKTFESEHKQIKNIRSYREYAKRYFIRRMMTNRNELEKILKELSWSDNEIKERFKNSKHYKPEELTTALLARQIRQFDLYKSAIAFEKTTFNEKLKTFITTISNELTYDTLRSLQLDELHWEFAFKMLHRVLPWHRNTNDSRFDTCVDCKTDTTNLRNDHMICECKIYATPIKDKLAEFFENSIIEQPQKKTTKPKLNTKDIFMQAWNMTLPIPNKPTTSNKGKLEKFRAIAAYSLSIYAKHRLWCRYANIMYGNEEFKKL